MTPTTHSTEELVVLVRQQWGQLTEEDVRECLKHRGTFVERLRYRHNLGLEEAERQLEAFEKKVPALSFEKSE